MLISPPSGVFEIDTLLDTRIGVWCLGCSESLKSLQSLTPSYNGQSLDMLRPIRTVTSSLERLDRDRGLISI